jgi:hypothetical protein
MKYSEKRRRVLRVAQYRKKPVVIEAVQFSTNNEVGSPQMDSVVNWVNQGRDTVGAWHNGTDIFIMTLEGEMRATVGDWIIKEPFPTGDRKFYPCKPDIFEATYDVV